MSENNKQKWFFGVFALVGLLTLLSLTIIIDQQDEKIKDLTSQLNNQTCGVIRR